MDATRAALSDRLEDAIDYSAVYEKVSRYVKKERFNLLETLAVRLAETLLADFQQLESVVVQVRKPQAPLPGIFEDVAVSVERYRGE